MHILNHSFLGTVNRRFRKAPPTEKLQNSESAPPLPPTPHEQPTGNVPEPIALSTPGRSNKSGSVDPTEDPIVAPDPTTPILQSKECNALNSQSEPSDQTEVLALASQESDPADGDPIIPEIAVIDADKDPTGGSPPDSDRGGNALRDLFVRKSSRNPAVRALLKRHQPVDSRALSNELKEFALRLGLPSRRS